MKTFCLIDKKDKTVKNRIVISENSSYETPSGFDLVEDTQEKAHIGDAFDKSKDEFVRRVKIKDEHGDEITMDEKIAR